jgi:hypothetical protein
MYLQCIYRVGQNHTYICIYTVYVRHFWQGKYRTYGRIRCTNMVLANPVYMSGNHSRESPIQAVWYTAYIGLCIYGVNGRQS